MKIINKKMVGKVMEIYCNAVIVYYAQKEYSTNSSTHYSTTTATENTIKSYGMDVAVAQGLSV